MSEKPGLRPAEQPPYPAHMEKRNPFKYFNTRREIIRLAVMLYIRFPLSLRNVEDLLHERGIDVSHESVRFWWQRFGPSSPPKSARSALNGCAHGHNGGGTWTRFS